MLNLIPPNAGPEGVPVGEGSIPGCPATGVLVDVVCADFPAVGVFMDEEGEAAANGDGKVRVLSGLNGDGRGKVGLVGSPPPPALFFASRSLSLSRMLAYDVYRSPI